MVERSSLTILFDTASDLSIISSLACLLIFSFFSFLFIIHFHFKTKKSRHLKDFNSLWTVRIFLVSFISLWALTEFLRLPFTQRQLSYIFPSTPTYQKRICQFHVVLSQGLFQPGFLVTLLFLVNFSIKKKNPQDTFGSAVAIVFALCIPILILQVYFIFFASKDYFKEILWKAFVVYPGEGRNDLDAVFCTYPLFSTIIFGTFAAIYVLFFLLSCWKVVALVINKGLRLRIYTLAFAILFALPVQVACLVISSFFTPDDVAFVGVALIATMSVTLFAFVGEGILVIRPIADAMAVGRESHWQEDVLPIVLGEKRVLVAG